MTYRIGLVHDVSCPWRRLAWTGAVRITVDWAGFGEGIDHDRNTAARLAVGGTSGRSATGTRRGELIPPGRARRREADLQDPVAERYSKRQSTADSLKLYQVIRAVTGAVGLNLRYRSCRLALPILDRDGSACVSRGDRNTCSKHQTPHRPRWRRPRTRPRRRLRHRHRPSAHDRGRRRSRSRGQPGCPRRGLHPARTTRATRTAPTRRTCHPLAASPR